MTARRPLRARLPLAALALALPLAAPSVGMAGGFGAPHSISGRDDVSDPVAVVSPTGRTAVLYSRRTDAGGRDRYTTMLSMAPSPDRLGRATRLTLPGAPAGARYRGAQLLARPDGGLLLCTLVGKVQGCSIAPPNGGFGPLIALPGKPTGLRPILRPDGTSLLMRSTETVRRGIVTRTTTSLTPLRADGQLGAEQPLVRSKDEQSYNGSSPSTAVLDDGTIVMQANLAVPGTEHDTQLGIRIMAPGTDTFGPIVPVPGKPYDNNITLLGGKTLTITYTAEGLTGDYESFAVRAITRLADGTFGPTLALPGATADSVSGTIVPLPDGRPFAVTSRVTTGEYDQDCFNPVTGEIGSGFLTPAGQPGPSERLSEQGQIAWHEQAVALADGTVIAAWHDGVNDNGDRRVDTAVRLPGATGFSKSRRLPRLLWNGEPILAAGGNQAALLWLVDGGNYRTTLAASAYRTAAPYAKFVPLPKHPGTSCDE